MSNKCKHENSMKLIIFTDSLALSCSNCGEDIDEFEYSDYMDCSIDNFKKLKKIFMNIKKKDLGR